MAVVRTAWRERVDARLDLLRCELSSYTDDAAAAQKVCITELLDKAGGAVTSRKIFGWWTGAPIECAWRKIHDAEVLLCSLRDIETLDSHRPELLSLVGAALPETDPQRTAAEKHFTDQAWARPFDAAKLATLRAQYIAALSSAYDASDEQYARLRSFRNILLTCAMGLLAISVAFALIGIFKPATVSLCFTANPVSTATRRAPLPQVCPTGRTSPTGGDIPLVDGLGVLGAALSATIAVRSLRGTSAPYGVPVALAALKLPAGAATAFVGLSLFRAKFVPGLASLGSQSQILIYAILFGYAQQIVTGLIDKQAQTVIGRTPSSEPSTAP